MNPILKILLIVGFAIYVLAFVGDWGWWAFGGAFIVWVIFYLFYLETIGVDLDD